MIIYLLGLACNSEQKAFDFASNSASDITWYTDIQPIMQQHCVRCHNETGIGVGDFRNVNEVMSLAPLMLAAMNSGTMPPPSSNPECRDYYNSDILRLSDGSANKLSQWIQADYPLGKTMNAQQYTDTHHKLENANLEVMMSEKYRPTFQSETLVGNEYRCFVLEHGQTDTFYINAMHPIVGNLKMAHHLSVDVINNEDIQPEQLSPDGFDCVNSEGVGSMLMGWGPGMTPQQFPEDVGVKIEPNQSFILEIHYNRGDIPEVDLEDQSGISMVVLPEVDTELHLLEMGVRDFMIEAGDSNFVASDTFRIEHTTKVWGVWPHMHNLGVGFDMVAHQNEEEQCLLEGDGYLYEGQQNYLFKEPIVFEKDTEVTISCHYNNSSSNPNLLYYPPQDTYPGFGTEFEMCEYFILASF